jgi:hypothetical protein
VTSSRKISDANSTTQSCDIRMRAAVLESGNSDAERNEWKRTIFHNGDCVVHIGKLAGCVAPSSLDSATLIKENSNKIKDSKNSFLDRR